MSNLPTRNNNPGDLKNTKTGMFNSYATPQEGFNALKNDLNIKITGKSKTGITPDSSLEHFASIYAPASDKNNPAKYAKDLADQLGVTPDTPIKNFSNRLDEFSRAIAKNEGYHGQQVAGTEQNASPEKPIAENSSPASPMLSHDKLIANINAMETQGAKPEEIQGYLDSLKDENKNTSPTENASGTFENVIKESKAQQEGDNLKSGVGDGKAHQVLDAVANTVGGGALARGAGYAISNALGTQKGLIKANQEGIDIEGKLLQQIKANKAKGKDTSRLEKALKELIPTIEKTGSQVSDVGTGGITNKEVLKSAGQLALLPTLAYGSTVLGGGGILGKARGLKSGVFGESAPKILSNPTIKGILEGSIGKGETLANLSRQDALTTLNNYLREMPVTQNGGKIEKVIVKALQELNPTVAEKKTLSAKALKLLGSAIKTAVGGTILGGAINKGEKLAGLLK